MKSLKEISLDFVEHSLIYYLNKKPSDDLEWIKLIIHISGVYPGDLKDILNEAKYFNIGDKKRLKELYKTCQKANFNCEEIKL